MASVVTTSAQLNVRMAPDTKAAGDATLERMGILPGQLVRAVWQKLALGEEAAAQLLRALVQKPAVGDGPYSPSTWEEYDSYQERREAFWARMEAVAGPPPAALDEDEMQELLYLDRLERDGERLVSHAL